MQDWRDGQLRYLVHFDDGVSLPRPSRRPRLTARAPELGDPSPGPDEPDCAYTAFCTADRCVTGRNEAQRL
jgi:hypothetical protein